MRPLNNPIKNIPTVDQLDPNMSEKQRNACIDMIEHMNSMKRDADRQVLFTKKMLLCPVYAIIIVTILTLLIMLIL